MINDVDGGLIHKNIPFNLPLARKRVSRWTVAQEQYRAYLNGKSTVEIAKLYRVKKATIIEKFRRRGWKLRPHFKYPPLIYNGMKFFPKYDRRGSKTYCYFINYSADKNGKRAWYELKRFCDKETYLKLTTQYKNEHS
jgi:hypothetical protein